MTAYAYKAAINRFYILFIVIGFWK